MTPAFRSAIYTGRVTHHRLAPKAHKLSYRVFSLLLDLDELPALDRGLGLFSWNRGNLVSFHSGDHGDRKGGLKAYAQQLCVEAGAANPPARVELLCYPRLWGYAFNPLAVYFCYDDQDRIDSVIYEVRNTFGERHSYVLPRNGDDDILRHACDKRFYVSPFMPMEARYRFRIRPPGDEVMLGIAQQSPDGARMNAVFTGQRRELGNAALARTLGATPLMTFKVMSGIHWEAFKLWRKGLPFHKRPAPPSAPYTVITSTPKEGMLQNDAI